MKEGAPYAAGAEDFKTVALKVRQPDIRHQNFGISVDTTNASKPLSSAYNRAIGEICKERNLEPFHQISSFGGSENPNLPGYHEWEFWAPIVEVEIPKLFPLIEARARELYPSIKKLYEDMQNDE